MPVSHLDLFRLAGLEEEEPELLEATPSRPGRVRRVARGGGPALAPACACAARVRLEHRGGDRRRVVIAR